MTFRDEPPLWISNVVGDRARGVRPYPEDLDTRAWPTEDGRQVAIVRIPPIASPPCITRGTVYERVSGRTITVTEPLRLAELFARGDQARRGAEVTANHAAVDMLSVNPFAGEAWAPSRNDQGLDYEPLKVEPIRAIGSGTIVGIGSWGSYGPWFDYRLASGQFAGKCVYVAEHIGSILAPGTSFNAGDTLATAYPGPYWTEWGRAKALDTPAVTWVEWMHRDGQRQPGRPGVRAVLRSLGAKPQQDPGPGPMYAGGSC